MKKAETNKHAKVTNFLFSCSARVDQRLDENFRRLNNFYGLLDAIRYSSIGGGKKIRPALIYAVAQIIGLPLEQADDIACSIELVHTYSLTHDDLPTMDDDNLRRGRPALHKAFNEALAILAGDAMQAIAFEILANSSELSAPCKVSAIRLLAKASGTEGMAGGQAMDIALSDKVPDIRTVETIHRLKTGSLISACVHIPLACTKRTSRAIGLALDDYASHIGLCFQIRDDVLDLETDASSGKKATYPSAIGLKNTLAELHRLGEMCMASLEPLGEAAQQLRHLTWYIVEREA